MTSSPEGLSNFCFSSGSRICEVQAADADPAVDGAVDGATVVVGVAAAELAVVAGGDSPLQLAAANATTTAASAVSWRRTSHLQEGTRAGGRYHAHPRRTAGGRPGECNCGKMPAEEPRPGVG